MLQNIYSKRRNEKNILETFKTKIISLLKEEILIHLNKTNFSNKESLVKKLQ